MSKSESESRSEDVGSETMPGPDDAYSGYTVIHLEEQIAADGISQEEFEEWLRLFREDDSDERSAEFIYPDGRSVIVR